VITLGGLAVLRWLGRSTSGREAPAPALPEKAAAS
jgi:hypothetical protein